MFYSQSPQEQANSQRIEFDPRSPKLRLSVMAYLLEHDIKPSETVSTAEFLETLDSVVGYVAAELDAFIDTIRELPQDEPAPPQIEGNPLQGFDPSGGSYL